MGYSSVASYRQSNLDLHQCASSGPAYADRNLPRPSWFVLIIVTAAVAGITWGVMRQRMPDIDPRQVIAVNLSSAMLALQDERYLDPPEHSAAHYFRSALALDPTNEQALRGLEGIAQHFIAQAKEAILEAKFAEAALAIESLRRLQPSNRRLELLEGELRKSLDMHVATSLADAGGKATTAKVTPSKPALPRAEAKQTTNAVAQEARDLALAQTQLAIDAGELTEARERISEARKRGVPDRDLVRLTSALEIAQENRELTRAREPAPVDAYSTIERAFEIAKTHIPARSDEPVPDQRMASTIPAAALVSVPPPTPAPIVKAVKLVEPNYPQAARARGIEGWVDLTLTVAQSGEVIDARIDDREGSRSFERAALLAVKQWKYEVSGAVDVQSVPVRVGFRLED